MFPTMDSNKWVCLEVSETTFKERHINHIRDGKHERYSRTFELTKYVWDLKQNKVPIITWNNS